MEPITWVCVLCGGLLSEPTRMAVMPTGVRVYHGGGRSTAVWVAKCYPCKRQYLVDPPADTTMSKEERWVDQVEAVTATGHRVQKLPSLDYLDGWMD